MKRSEQIVELMDDVKKIISQMAVVDVCEEEKPVEVGKTIMTSREVADMFQEYHSVTYRRIAQLIVDELQTKGAVLQKMGKPTKSGTRMTFAPVRSAGEYEAEMQRILEDGKKLGLKFEKKKEEK